MARNRARCFIRGVVALGVLLTGCATGDASPASSDSTPVANTEIATLHDNVALMVRAVKQDVAVPPPVVGPVLTAPTPVVAPEPAPAPAPAPAPVPVPVPEPVAPVLPTVTTSQPGDGLYSLANRLTASHPELKDRAGQHHFADYIWNCNAAFIPNPNKINVGLKLSLQCHVTPDEIIPISLWKAPEPVQAPVAVAHAAVEAPAASAAPAPAGFANPLDVMHVTSHHEDANPQRSSHRGVDLRARTPLPMYAMTDVTIVEAGPATGFGYWVIARANVNGQVVDFVYGHMDSLHGVTKGMEFKKGERIGFTGSNSGGGAGSAQPHLHLEVWIGGRLTGGYHVDPAPWLRAHGVNI